MIFAMLTSLGCWLAISLCVWITRRGTMAHNHILLLPTQRVIVIMFYARSVAFVTAMCLVFVSALLRAYQALPRN